MTTDVKVKKKIVLILKRIRFSKLNV